MFPRIPLLLGLMVFAASASAVEWQQAQFSLGTGPLIASLRSDNSYPLAIGMGVQADYQVPVFVEGHTRAYARGALNWAQHKPDVEDDQHGTTSYNLNAVTGLLHDLKLGGKVAWVGGGLGLHSLSQLNHYSWHQDGNDWSQTQYDNSHDLGVVMQGVLQVPVHERLFVDLTFNWPFLEPNLMTTRLSVNFKLN